MLANDFEGPKFFSFFSLGVENTKKKNQGRKEQGRVQEFGESTFWCSILISDAPLSCFTLKTSFDACGFLDGKIWYLPAQSLQHQGKP